jgi:hypothetical protein
LNFERIRYVTEVVGILAIVASLIFVGLQMRQNHEIALVTLYQMRSDAARELGAAQLESDALLAIDAKVTRGQELSEYEEYVRSIPDFIFFNHFENSHHLYQLGYLTQEHWRSDLAAIRSFVKDNSRIEAYWEKNKSTYRTSYVIAVDQALR